MRVAIIGAGPTGLFLGAALQRRGHAVTVVDRDGGPEPDGSWPRKGVMQFHHAHAFRGPVAGALQRELPEAYTRWVELGAEPVTAPGSDELAGIRSQRSTFERALREVAATVEPGLVLRQGPRRAASATSTGSRSGSTSTAQPVPAELVLDASGRSSPVTRDLGERDGLRGRLRPGLRRPAVPAAARRRARPAGSAPIAWQGDYAGLPGAGLPRTSEGIFSTVIMRHSRDAELKLLRHDAAYDAACAAIPALAAWTDPARRRAGRARCSRAAACSTTTAGSAGPTAGRCSAGW